MYEEPDNSYFTFLKYFGGRQFGNGLFRVFRQEKLQIWNDNVIMAYPQFSDQFELFAYDWLGRCFGIDLRVETRGNILMFEIGTNDVLEIPCQFLDFLNEEIPMHSEACLASEFYLDWLSHSGKPVEYDRCIGYKVPLFLGGEDTIDNLENSDMDVYWHIISQVISNQKP